MPCHGTAPGIGCCPREEPLCRLRVRFSVQGKVEQHIGIDEQAHGNHRPYFRRRYSPRGPSRSADSNLPAHFATKSLPVVLRGPVASDNRVSTSPEKLVPRARATDFPRCVTARSKVRVTLSFTMHTLEKSMHVSSWVGPRRALRRVPMGQTVNRNPITSPRQCARIAANCRNAQRH